MPKKNKDLLKLFPIYEKEISAFIKTNKINRRPTCHDVRHGVQSKCPHGSIRTSFEFSAHILHSWKVEPISQYNSYCSCVTLMWSSGASWTAQLRSGLTVRPSGNK